MNLGSLEKCINLIFGNFLAWTLFSANLGVNYALCKILNSGNAGDSYESDKKLCKIPERDGVRARLLPKKYCKFNKESFSSTAVNINKTELVQILVRVRNN